MLIPQDEHLTHLMDVAMATLEKAKVSVDDLLEALPQARAEVVTEHYGTAFLDALERAAAEQGALADTSATASTPQKFLDTLTPNP